MRTLLILLVIFITGAFNAFSATDSIGVQEKDGKKYIVHQVQPGQNINVLSNRYGVTPQNIRDANPDVKEVKVYDYLLIPFEPGQKRRSTAKQEAKNLASEQRDAAHSKEARGQSSERKEVASERSGVQKSSGGRKTHKVEAGQTLFRISRIYEVTVNDLQEWNGLDDYNISPGQELYVEPPGKDGSSTIPPRKLPDKPEEKVQTPEKPDENARVPDDFRDTLDIQGYSEVNEKGKAGWLENERFGDSRSLAVHRSAPTGTIIQVKNQMNNRIAYVRVVGQLPDTPDNKDLIIKISKAAAKKLDVRDPHFRAELQYANESTP